MYTRYVAPPSAATITSSSRASAERGDIIQIRARRLRRSDRDFDRLPLAVTVDGVRRGKPREFVRSEPRAIGRQRIEVDRHGVVGRARRRELPERRGSRRARAIATQRALTAGSIRSRELDRPRMSRRPHDATIALVGLID